MNNDLGFKRKKSSIITLDAENIISSVPLLRGMAISETAIVLGDDGLSEMISKGVRVCPNEWEDGRFFAVVEDGEKIRILTDPMGQDTIYVYSSEGMTIDGAYVDGWIASNSFLQLAQTVKERDLPITFSPSVISASLSTEGRGFGAQLLSNRTPIKQVFVLPIGCEIEVCKFSRKAKILRKRKADFFIESIEGSFEDLLEVFVIKTCARLKALIDSNIFDINFDLSGGHDSRALVGFALKIGADLNAIPVYSNKKWMFDLASAKQVSQEFGFPLRTTRDPILVAPGAYDLWKLSSLGVYLPVYAHGAPTTENNSLIVHGGNFLSKEFGEKSAFHIASKLASRMSSLEEGEKIKQIFFSAFDSIGIDPGYKWASHLHYLNFRARFHYGRNWVGNTRRSVITPLISPFFARAAFKLQPQEYNNLRPSMELLMSLDNRLVELPFDSVEKNFSKEQMELSPFYKKSIPVNVSVLPTLTIYGKGLVAPKISSNNDMASLDCLRKDFKRYSKSSVQSGAIKPETLIRAQEVLEGTSSLPNGGRLAALVVSAGTFWELSDTCDQ